MSWSDISYLSKSFFDVTTWFGILINMLLDKPSEINAIHTNRISHDISLTNESIGKGGLKSKFHCVRIS